MVTFGLVCYREIPVCIYIYIYNNNNNNNNNNTMYYYYIINYL